MAEGMTGINWGSVGGDAIGTGLQFLSNVGSAFINQGFTNYNRKKNAEQSFKNYTKQGLFDYQLANGPYFDLAQRYNEANYNLSRRYAENSAKWATTGLRKAGLNPILAASQGFNAQTGAQGAQMSPSSSGAPSFNQSTAVRAPDVMEGLRDLSATRLSDANAKLVENQGEQVRAETLRTLIGAINDAGNRGISGYPTLFSRWFSDVSDGAGGDSRVKQLLDDFLSSKGVDTRGDAQKIWDLGKVLITPNPDSAADSVNSASSLRSALDKVKGAIKDVGNSDFFKSFVDSLKYLNDHMHKGVGNPGIY